VCIFVYVGADHALDGFGGSTMRVSPVKRRNRMHRDLRDGVRHLYLAFDGCACDLTLDGADAGARAKRDALLDNFESFLAKATAQGPVQALVTDGDTRTPPGHVSITAPEFRDFDFDSAWQVPTLLTITSG
jgi:hypothetical protein